MVHHSHKSAINMIELLWSTISREKSDDPRSYEYIATQSMVLKMAVIDLKMEVAQKIQSSKKEKLKYQKLHSSLTSILDTLDYDPTPCKDENYIQNILDRLRKIRGDVETLLKYQ